MLRYFLILVLLMSLKQQADAQGCSDAGFCTVGALQTAASKDSIYKQQLTATLSYGLGEQQTAIYQIIPEWKWQFIQHAELQAKVPIVATSGNLGKNKGIGDVTIAVSQEFIQTKKIRITASAGVKLPTGSTDKKQSNSTSLPMPYQTGLGTTDLIVGASFSYIKWMAGLGFQGVLDDRNKNTFSPASYADHKEAALYFESNLLRRGNDALMRVERLVKYRKFAFMPGVLAIYRLRNDKLTNPNGEEISINGSNGLTLNITAHLVYKTTKKINTSLTFGAPVIVRENRGDGLTRSAVVNMGIQYQFGRQKTISSK